MEKPIKKIKKKNFPRYGLIITTETNLIQADFLDIILKLAIPQTQRQPIIRARPFHPPAVREKHLPSNIERRVSQLSCDVEAFRKASPIMLYVRANTPSTWRIKRTASSPSDTGSTRHLATSWQLPPKLVTNFYARLEGIFLRTTVCTKSLARTA